MAFNSCTNVLIVEDNFIVALIIEAIVEGFGCCLHRPQHRFFDMALYAARLGDLDHALLDFHPAERQSCASRTMAEP